MKYPYTGGRIGATIVDYAIIFFFTFFYVFIVGKVDNTGTYHVSGFPALGPELFWFSYLVLPETFSGMTLGHFLCGVRVVSENGRELSFRQVLVRRVADIIDLSFSFGLVAFTLVKSTGKHQRLGDLWAKTLVIDRFDVYPEITFDFEQKQP